MLQEQESQRINEQQPRREFNKELDERQEFFCNLRIVKVMVLLFIVVASVFLVADNNNNLHSQIANLSQGIQNKDQTVSQKKSQKNITKSGPNVFHNPYNDDNHTFISKQQIAQAKIWKDMFDHDSTLANQLKDKEKQYYLNKYNTNLYKELPFCIIVPTYNNKLKRRHIRNIRSVFYQDYAQFRVIIIDDASVDGTIEEVQEWISRQKIKHQYKITKNPQRLYSLANIHKAAVQFCKPKQVMMVVDGDDELIGSQVLKVFNAVFQEKKVWFAYSNSLASNGNIGYSRPYHPAIVEENSYRLYDFAVSHLRAYYTSLFLKVNKSDLLDQNGNYLQSAGDMAVCLPMLEMAHHKIVYIPEITYFYNMNTGLNVHKNRLSQQRANSLMIRQHKSYKALISLFPI